MIIKPTSKNLNTLHLTIHLSSHQSLSWEGQSCPQFKWWFSVKLLDWCDEKSISVVKWHAASCAAEERTCFHHGDVWAEALTLHHRVAMDLSCTHNWEIVVEYDIQQHKLNLFHLTQPELPQHHSTQHDCDLYTGSALATPCILSIQTSGDL